MTRAGARASTPHRASWQIVAAAAAGAIGSWEHMALLSRHGGWSREEYIRLAHPFDPVPLPSGSRMVLDALAMGHDRLQQLRGLRAG